MKGVKYYLKQLFPLTYRAKHQENRRQIFSVWKMWFGHTYKADSFEICWSDPSNVTKYRKTEIKCPYCSKRVLYADHELKYHKNGREANCPFCKKRILLTYPTNALKRDQHNSLVKKI